MAGAKYTARIQLAITPGMRLLIDEASRSSGQSLSDVLRPVLERGLGITPRDNNSERYEVEIMLTHEEAADLARRGYQLFVAPPPKMEQLPLLFPED